MTFYEHLEHVTQLKNGAQSWNDWRQRFPNLYPDLSGANLSEIAQGWEVEDKVTLDLSYTKLKYCTISNMVLQDVNLSKANLSYTDLRDTEFANTNIQDAIFHEACLIGADLSEAQNITKEQLETAIGDYTTLLPEDIPYPESWPEKKDEEDDQVFNESEHNYFSVFSSDPYRILGVVETTSFEDIRKAYLELVKKFHPDLNPDGPDCAIKRINWAYEILSNPEKLAEYQAELSGYEYRQDYDDKDFGQYKDESNVSSIWFRFGSGMSLSIATGVLLFAITYIGVNYVFPNIGGESSFVERTSNDTQVNESQKKHDPHQVAERETETEILDEGQELSKTKSDELAWKKAITLNTEEAFASYQRDFPEGRFIKKAETRLSIMIKAREHKNADHKAWLEAKKLDTREAIKDYKKQFPEGRFFKDAEQRIAELIEIEDLQSSENVAWGRAVKLNTEKAYKTYKKDFPEGKFIKEATVRLAALRERKEQNDADFKAWRQAVNLNTEQAFLDYKESFPGGNYKAEADQRIATLVENSKKHRTDHLAWNAAVKINTEKSFGEYLRHFPKGKFSEYAEVRLASLKKARELKHADDKAWLEAFQLNTQESFSKYKTRFPEGYYVEEAKERIAKLIEREKSQRLDTLAWEKAIKLNTEKSFETYTKKFPQGKYTHDAKLRLSNLRKAKDDAGVINFNKNQKNAFEKQSEHSNGDDKESLGKYNTSDEVMIGPL